MAGDTIRLKTNDRNVRDLMESLARRLADMTPALAEIGEILGESVKNNFKSEHSPQGTPWKPLSARTLARRRLPGRILNETGTLRNALHVSVSGNRVTVGTNVIYAAVHQFGARQGQFGEVQAKVRPFVRRDGTRVRAHTRRMRVPWGDIPARPFLGKPQERDWAEIKATLARFIATGR